MTSDCAEQVDATNSEIERARRFRKIYPSFSHSDSDIVCQFKEYAKAVGDQYVGTCTKLRGGEVLNNRLQELIGESDVFQLFWSKNSMHSPFVRSEWEHALSLQRQGFVRPVYWQEPFPSDAEKDLPPAELRQLSFQRINLPSLVVHNLTRDKTVAKAGVDLPVYQHIRIEKETDKLVVVVTDLQTMRDGLADGLSREMLNLATSCTAKLVILDLKAVEYIGSTSSEHCCRSPKTCAIEGYRCGSVACVTVLPRYST